MPDAPAHSLPDAPLPDRVVACLCAGWCTACQAYVSTFAAVAAAEPQARFVWIDIETHADALGDAALEIENFPTVMLLRQGRPEFFGTILPHASTLTRMLAAARAGHLADGGHNEISQALAPAVWQLAQALPAAGSPG
jgi:thiol-disulfide isomerase/thioredoxin